jgi:hypothetical protein
MDHFAAVTQLVECDLAKVDVAGSNPVRCLRTRNKHWSRRRLLTAGMKVRFLPGVLRSANSTG